MSYFLRRPPIPSLSFFACSFFIFSLPLATFSLVCLPYSSPFFETAHLSSCAILSLLRRLPCNCHAADVEDLPSQLIPFPVRRILTPPKAK